MALEFNETATQYVTLPDVATLKPASSLTICAWMLYSDCSLDYPCIMSFKNSGAILNGYQFALIEDGGAYDHRLTFKVGSGEGQYTCGADYSSYWGAWHHVAGVCHIAGVGNGYIRLYVDGVQIAESTGSYSDIIYAGALGVPTVGADSALPAAGYFKGQLADVRLYPTELTVADLLSITHTQGGDGIAPNPALRLPMDGLPDGSSASDAGSITDLSVNGSYGTPVNTPTYRAAPIRTHTRPIIMAD